jgi:hypothetical protein
LLNSIYQAQMHNYIAFGFGVKLCLIFDEKEHLLDFIWGIKTLRVMSDLRECTIEDQERIFIHTINLI